MIGKSRIMVRYPERCTGCLMCELSCSYFHYHVFNPNLSRIYIEKDEHKGVENPLVCVQCKNPVCEKVCPVQAFYKTPDGYTHVDEEKCTGCGACVEACPFKAIRINSITNSLLRCDLCDGEAHCVQWCPTGVLEYDQVIPLIKIFTETNNKRDE